MNKDIACAVVKDLLPNYIDKLTSKETNQILENHLTDCTDCSNVCNEMMGTIKLDKVPKQPNLKFFLNKTKRMYLLKGVSFSIGIIGILVSFIVDIAVNHKLTWSLIVDASLFYFYAIVLTAIFSKKNKTINTTLVSSVLVLPLLYMIEVVINANYLINPCYWFISYALPITLIWLAIIWSFIICWKIMKLRIWNNLGITFLLAILGSALTNSIANQVSITKLYHDSFEWINSIVYMGCAILCFIIAFIRKDKCK
jgi:predicted neutral ceramidase superfamily lipid hydrolase